MFEINLIIFRPYLDVFINVYALPVQNKMNTDTKVTVVMWCKIFDRMSTAPSSGHFFRRPPPR